MGKNNKIFYKAKGIKEKSERTPLRGTPNTFLDVYFVNTGRFKQRRKFDSDGFAKTDLDVEHYDHNKFDHAHDFVNHQRTKKRDLSKKEKREVKKAKRKKRSYD